MVVSTDALMYIRPCFIRAGKDTRMYNVCDSTILFKPICMSVLAFKCMSVRILYCMYILGWRILIYLEGDFVIVPPKFAFWGVQTQQNRFFWRGTNPHTPKWLLVHLLKFKMYFFANCHNNNCS